VARLLWPWLAAAIKGDPAARPPKAAPPATVNPGANPRTRFYALFQQQPTWTRGELLVALKVGRYRTDQLLHEAIARGLVERRGRTQAARFVRTALPYSPSIGPSY
jgi:hypothetical protein